MPNRHIAKIVLGVSFILYAVTSAAVGFTSVTGDYTKIDQVSAFPHVITDIFNNLPGCHGLAEKSENMVFSCVHEDSNPCARLVSGGRFNNIWFMIWEAGGAAHHYEFFAFSLTENGNKIFSLIHRGGLEDKDFSQSELTNLLADPPKCDPISGYQHNQYKIEVDYGLCAEPL